MTKLILPSNIFMMLRSFPSLNDLLINLTFTHYNVPDYIT